MFVNMTPHMIRIKGLETGSEQVLEIKPSGVVATSRPIMGVDEVRRSDKFEYNITTRSLGPSHLATGSSSPPRMGIRSTSYPTWRKKPCPGPMSWPRPDVLVPDTGPTAKTGPEHWAVTRLIGPKN